VTEDDRIVFPGDAAFSYIEAARANPTNKRVYVLKFTGSSERLYFWMQDPDASKDSAFIDAANRHIAPDAAMEAEPSGDAPPEAVEPGQMSQAQLVSMLSAAGNPAASATPAIPAAEPGAGSGGAAAGAAALAPSAPSDAAPAPAAAPVPGAGPLLSASSLSAILAGIGGGAGSGGGAARRAHGPSLSDVLDGRALVAALGAGGAGGAGGDAGLEAALLEHLPESDRSASGLRAVSPRLHPPAELWEKPGGGALEGVEGEGEGGADAAPPPLRTA